MEDDRSAAPDDARQPAAGAPTPTSNQVDSSLPPSVPSVGGAHTPAPATREAPQPLAARHASARASQRWNPFYVLSAFSMLASCYALNYDFMRGPESLAEIVRPLAALQLYEILVLATAVLLVRTHRAPADARLLVLIEAPFLVDATYFLGEAAAFAPHAGAWLAAAGFGLAVLKLAALNAGMGLGWQRGERAHLVLLLALLHALPPILMRGIASGPLHPIWLHAAWWSVAIALAAKPDHIVTRHIDMATDLGASIEALFRRVLFVALAGSLIAHLVVLHFVHDVTYFRGNAAPLLLAFTALLTRDRFGSVQARLRRAAITAMPLLAIAVNLALPRSVLRPIATLGDLVVSPYWIAVLASTLVYVLAVLRLHSMRFGLLAAAGALVAMAGQTPGDAADAIAHRVHQAWLATNALAPRTLGEWGVIGVGIAFALLGLGIRASLRVRPTPLAASQH